MSISVNTLNFWCQKVIPLVYDDSLSYYENLCKIVEATNTIINEIDDIEKYFQQFNTSVEEIKADMNSVKAEIEKIKNGEYIDVYIDALGSWIDNNLQVLVGKIVKFVSFGLTDDGYFVTYIPQTWDFLVFDTILNPDDKFYGHLVMEW